MREHVHTVDDAINMHEHLVYLHGVDDQTMLEADSWRALHTQLHEDALCPKCRQPTAAHGPGLGQISNQGCKMVELHLALEAERSNRVVVGEMRIDGAIVRGPCPGCDNWQLDYPDGTHPAVVEEALAEHARECGPLMALVVHRVFTMGPH